MSRGNLFVISGPSGVGKGTIVSRIVEEVPDARLSVSATTREMREGEVDGTSYLFMDRPAFQAKADAGGFLEWAEYAGNLYGTPLDFVEEQIAQGKQVILEIEVQGALQVKEKLPEARLVFIEPPSMEELHRRLVGRGTESDEAVAARMAAAEVELSQKMGYDKQLVNDSLDRAVAELADYIRAASAE